MADLGTDAESAENIIAKKNRLKVFLPPIDYSTASNFAVYGSAEKYYTDAVKRVYLEYPYDGSEKEINEYILSSSFLDQYIFNKRYPRTNGFARFATKNSWGSLVDSSGDYGAPATSSYEYITFYGGPNTSYNTNESIASAFSSSHNQNNIFDLSKKRGSNLALNPTSGSTVEFWLNKSAFLPALTKKEVILDIWNGNGVRADSSYGRFMIEISASGHASQDATGRGGLNPFRLTYLSGTTGISNQVIGSTSLTTSSIADNTWAHYAITVVSSSDEGLNAKLYINGELDDSRDYAAIGTMNEVTGAFRANIGSLMYEPPIGTDAPNIGWGKLSADLDEFRYWKIERSAKDIGRNWFTQVRGGTNTDDANVDLGVYFKFNEGVTGEDSADSTVLDYSGRISNGSWTGYDSQSRNSGSAIVLSRAASSEFKDPIIYSSHPDVESILSELKLEGRVYDQENNSSIINSMPAWIVESDTNGDLQNLVQIVASYFDRLQNQIRELPRIKNISYLSSSYASPAFASELVNSTGMFASEMFIDSNIIEEIMSRDEDRNFDLDFDEIRNRIYQNIYNNLIYINKTKGTEKAFRNLIHCYGVDESLIRMNMYGDEVTYELKDNFRSSVVAKNLVDFTGPGKNQGTIFQMSASNNSDSVSFITGSGATGKEDFIGFTLESEILFPTTPGICETTASIGNPIVTSSLFGMHGANGYTPADTTWPENDYADIRVVAIRPGGDFNEDDAYFMVTSSFAGLPTLTTDTYKDVYNNNKWNFAIRIINDKYPLGDVVTGVSGSDTGYKLEFYGVNQTLDVTEDEFYITGDISTQDAVNVLRSDKRVFAGAHRTNFTGSILQFSDVKLSSVRYWANQISNDVIKAHARDTSNYGTFFPHRNAFLNQSTAIGTYIPEIETLALNWSFDNLTGSSPTGRLEVLDSSSGSLELQDRYGWLGKVVKAQHTAVGFGFPFDDKKVINREFIHTAKQSLPENVQSSEMVNILSRDDEVFTRDQRPVNYYFSIEKSMYQVISDEILNTFATIVEFNNLIGDPVNRYRQDYKILEKARSLYFEDVENVPSLDKFIDFYKWIDSSLSNFLYQLIPASAKSSNQIRTLIESHILERNKYWTKFPTLEKKVPGGPSGLVTAAASLGGGTSDSPYRSRDGANAVLDSAPIPYVETKHASYWKKRASRTESPLATGITGVDNDKQTILNALQSGYDRDISRPFVLNKKVDKTFHGGTNYPKIKKKDIIFNATSPDGPQATSGVPLNVMLVNDTEVQNFENIDDILDPNKKKFYSFTCRIRREDETGLQYVNNNTYTSVLKGDIAAPFRLVSGSITTGYNKLIAENFKTGTILTNLHEDTFVTNERSLQGPFTDAHVGGHQSRHIDINRFDPLKATIDKIDNQETRPEAWRILIGTEYGTDTTMLGITGPDYPYPVGPYPYTLFKKASRYRNVGAKRPVNIRNINYTTASNVVGNYSNNYEIFQTAGRSINNKYFVANEGISLPTSPLDLKAALPQTNTLSTLLGLKFGYTSLGNYFGVKLASDGALDVSNRYEILGNFDTIMRTGSATKSIFVNRFSAPGGPEVNTVSYLDIAAAEKSAYNALPFRNLSVLTSGSGEAAAIRADNLNRRIGLRTLLKEHAGSFGTGLNATIPTDEYASVPSWHKVNRNPVRRIEINGDKSPSDNSYVTGTIYDNGFISHAIPRGDHQYSWISASAAPFERIYGHAYGDSVISSSVGGFQQAILFLSQSHNTVSATSGKPIVVDFVGLNTLIVENIDVENNIASGSSGKGRLGDYINIDFKDDNLSTTFAAGEVLNALLLHRNGPYGVNTWTQIRGGDKKLTRLLRNRNIISHFNKTEYEYPLKTDNIRPKQLRGKLFNFTEAPLQKKFNSLSHNVSIKTTTSDGREITKNASFETSYGNALSYFNNAELDNLLADQTEQISVPAYDKIINLYTGDQTNNPDSPIEKFNSLTYKERVYPSSINVFSASVRVRQDYSNTFWRNDRTGRARSNVFSFGKTISDISMWSLDADTDWATRQPNTRVGTSGGPGVLQNNYSQIHNGDTTKIFGSVQYARRHTLENVRSVVGPEGLDIPATGTYYTSPLGYRRSHDEDRFGGQALWEAASQAGKTPWYNSYDDYVQEMRLAGKEYSIVPEFRISDHIELYYKADNSNFLADRLDLLKIEGGDSNKNNSSKRDFFKTYTNSDFLKYFGVVRDDLKDTGSPSSIKLTCGALLKFLPYNGFYPSERTVEIASMFSSSYGNYLNLDRKAGMAPETAFRTFNAPMFAPGVMYNTIKSGIAVDYPVMTSSFDTHGLASAEDSCSYISGTNGLGLFGYRVPFESLVEPESYLSDVDLFDMETHPSAALSVTASWAGQGGNLYKMMASNFLAESIDFFLPEGKLTTISSKPEDQWESAEKGRVYAARVKMRKTYNKSTIRTGSQGYYNPLTPASLWRQADYHETFTMYSRPSAFGPPVGGGTQGTAIYGSTNGFNPCFTPPYYYGECWADIFWTADKAGNITAEDITNSNSLAISYIRIGNDWALSNATGKGTVGVSSRNTLLHSDNIESNSMQLDASLNLLAKAETKKIIYDANTGKPTIAEDGGQAVLTVQTKFETPMLNFAEVSVTNPTHGSASIPRGMWHQYAQPPSSPDIGVFLSINDVPDNYIENALGGVPASTGSLIDLLGFKTEEQRLGEVSETKKISEAIVAIPYIEKGGERKFFEISRKVVDEALLDNPTVSNSVKQMVDSMQKYILPPKLDFVENPDAVDPFAMYIFEFEHVLDRDDLVDIWQGLPPKIGQAFDSESTQFTSGKGPHTSQIIKEVEISHPLLVGELLNKDNIPSKLRWMVFKIKKKAQKNYFDKVIKDHASNGGRFDSSKLTNVGRINSSKGSSPKYTYNWPYDFFSLVELVKLDAEIEISNDLDSQEKS